MKIQQIYLSNPRGPEECFIDRDDADIKATILSDSPNRAQIVFNHNEGIINLV